MARELTALSWIEELLPSAHTRRRMFGGFAYYLDERLILVMFESTGNRRHNNKNYDFELWNGCMFPVEKEHQLRVRGAHDFLIPHPVLPKWLYLPLDSEGFDSHAEQLVKELRRRNPLFGSAPKAKKSAKPGRAAKAERPGKIDTRRPRMFADEPAAARVRSAKKISDLRNLGPVSEQGFRAAGIRTVDQFVKLGWQKAMAKLVRHNPKSCHSLYAYALIGALKNQDWNRISEEDKAAARKHCAELRKKI